MPAWDELKILIVDDQQHVREWVRNVLGRMGVVHIADAENGRQALQSVTEPGESFDIIICDLNMPDVDGIEMIRAFASMQLRSAVIIASIESERVIDAAGILADEQGLRLLGTIAKPITPEKLEPFFKKMVAGAGTPDSNLAVLAPDVIRDRFSEGELLLHYQPKVVLATGRLAGVEALVRWRHPELGLVLPDAFVEMCAQSDERSDALLNFTVREAIAFAARWIEVSPDFSVAINLSAQLLDRLDFPEWIDGIAREAGVSPKCLILEITETFVARDALQMLDVVSRLRLKGFALSVDDFGTGHSGLTQLKRLPFSELKIDRSFVHGCSESGAKRAVVEASLALARNLRMTTVAEGIQRRPDWDLLQALGCEQMQGFFIARPMSEEGLHAWAAQWNLRN